MGMKRIGYTELPLHGGKAPRWLFEKMVELSREIIRVIVIEWGKEELLRRLSDPFWFQSFGCLLGFDWHSSGLTTTTTGAVKEALKQMEGEIGIFAAGGKGKAALKTPAEIEAKCMKYGIDAGDNLIRASRLCAKVDSAALQDGFSLYHHTIFFTTDGGFCVVQQGMDPDRGTARRYHWLSHNIKSFCDDPHTAVCCDERRKVLNLVASESKGNRSGILELVKEADRAMPEIELVLKMPHHHHIDASCIDPRRIKSVLLATYEHRIKSFEDLLLVKGVGPAFLRALSLTSEVIYGKPASFRDPARFSYAHGGKDGHPYPVNIRLYKHTIEVLKEVVNKAKIGHTDKMKALKRLSRMEEVA